jgi:hypothetical protein
MQAQALHHRLELIWENDDVAVAYTATHYVWHKAHQSGD